MQGASSKTEFRSQALVHVRKSETIYHECDPARIWYEVVSGIVRTCRFHSDGHRQLTGFFYAGDVFGVDEETYKETAEAVTDVRLRAHVPSTGSAGGVHADEDEPPLRRALDSAQRSIFLLGRKTATERVAAFLISMRERLDADDDVYLPMTRSDIGDHLGLTLHTVSRTISDLSRRGLIALDGRQQVRILDLEGLRRLAGEDGGQPPRGQNGAGDALLVCEAKERMGGW